MMMMATTSLPLLLLIATTGLLLPSSTHAGGKTLSPQESTQFLEMFRRICSGGGGSSQQQGNTFFYCKTADNGPVTMSLTHDAEVSAADTPKQVIFIQPPATNYLHNVALRGPTGNAQETSIYVLPGTASHQLQLQDTRSAAQNAKPQLYFLSSNDQQQQGSSSSSSSSAFPPSPIARQPPSGLTTSPNRPSAPPPPTGSVPNVIGIDSTPQQQQQGYSFNYGPPAPFVNPRNQRNALRSYVAGASYAVRT